MYPDVSELKPSTPQLIHSDSPFTEPTPLTPSNSVQVLDTTDSEYCEVTESTYTHTSSTLGLDIHNVHSISNSLDARDAEKQKYVESSDMELFGYDIEEEEDKALSVDASVGFLIFCFHFCI